MYGERESAGEREGECTVRERDSVRVREREGAGERGRVCR